MADVRRPSIDKEDQAYLEKPVISDFKADAIEAENAEHNMTVLEAVRAYPMASFWAFVMSCTIVGVSVQRIQKTYLTRPADHGVLRRLPHR